jgi:APA family basic amino acid/polyamine antiporter
MGPALATSIVVSNVIGVGIFTTPGFLARDLGDPWLILTTWLAGGVLALAGALCYAELGATLPRAGGEYAFLREAYGPLPSFLSGWASLLAGFSAPIAAGAIGFTEYFSYYFPALSTQRAGTSESALFLPGNYVAASVIIALSAVHYRKIQIGGRVHLGLTTFKVGIISVFVICGFLFGKGNVANFAPVVPVAQWPDLASSIAVAMIIIMFSYSGWNAGAYIGGEIRDPQRNLPRSLFLGTLTVVVLYLAMNAVYIYAVPLGQMSEVIQIAELASLSLFGTRVGPFLNIIFMGTILGSISAMIIVGPRVYYAMAEDGVFPETIAKIHPRFGTPGNAIVLQAVCSVSFVFLAGFRELLTFSGVVLILFAALTVASLYFVRRKNAGRPRPYSSWGYPWTMVLFLVASAWILVGSFRNRPKALLWGLAVVASGIPFFYYWKQKRRGSSRMTNSRVTNDE